MRQQWLLDDFVHAIKALPEKTPLRKADLLTDDFRIVKEDGLEIFYAPFDYVNRQAKVIVVGITPGWTQMEVAYRQARLDLVAGLGAAEVCRRAKEQAGFAGGMRANLVSMLDGIGLPGYLGLRESGLLFSSHRSLLHTTSAIRYPVFVERKNYTGHRPKLLKHETLRTFLDTHLAQELEEASGAVIVPLGKAVSEALSYLVERGVVDQWRCLIGFPHPSGLNVRRVQQFNERKDRLEGRLQSWFASRGSRA
jgi:hypothetical protein